MKKLVVLGMGLCVAWHFPHVNLAKVLTRRLMKRQNNRNWLRLLLQPKRQRLLLIVAAPVATAPAPAPVAGPVREEKVELVSGDGLKAYSVVCGGFGVKANAEGLKQYLDGQGYSAKVVYNPERNMYRVIAVSFDDRAQATQAKEEFKAKYPNRDDFQKAWLLYRVY